jgi:Tol biopolymer transport system component
MLLTRFITQWMLASVLSCVVAVSVALVMGQARHTSELALIELQAYGATIYLLDIDRDRFFFVSRAYSDCHLSWSPDGSQIAFSTGNREVSPELSIYTLSNSQFDAPALDNTTSESYVSWSPDGQYIALLSYHDGTQQISLIRPDGSSVAELGQVNTAQQHIVWFADSQRFLIGGKIFDIISEEIITFAPDVRYSFLSPDNTQVIYQAARENNLDIYLYDLNSQQESRLTDSSENDFSPIWSPDGSQIAFISDRDTFHALWLMDTHGSNQHALFLSPFTEMQSLSWSPDGSRIAFAARDVHPDYLGYIEENMEYNLYLVDVDGANLREIFEGYSDYQFTFSQYCGLMWRP